MSDQVTDNQQETKGYFSAASKKKFSSYAGILCIIFFLAQFIVPMVAMFSFMPTMMSGMMRDIDPQSGASWQNRIWFLEKGPAQEDQNFFTEGPGPFKLTLKYLTLDNQQEELNPVEVTDLTLEDPFLLNTHDKLWILSSSYIGYVDESGLVKVADDFVLGDISRPFIYENNPAVIEEHPAGYSLMVFRDGVWSEATSISQDIGENPCCFLSNIRVVTDYKRPLFFYRQGGTLFYRDSVPNGVEKRRSGWESVANIGSDWDVVMLRGVPSIFYQEHQQELSSSRFVGLRLANGNWEEFFSHSFGMSTDFGIYPFTDGSFAILRSGFPGSFSIINVDVNGEESVLKSGSGSFFPKEMMFAMMTPHLMMMFTPFILAIILTSLMRKYRVVAYKVGPVTIPHASLTKRAIAQIVDAVIMAGPFLVGWLSIMDSFSDIDKFPGAVSSGFPSGFILIFGGIFWIFACLFFYSFMEGQWGISPGKWLVGIRVLGTDLSPCGLGRAIIRNLLKFVDGFFNFMVGIIIVALSDNWQRVGDMAARTVVIDIKEARKSDLPELQVEVGR